MSGYDRSLTVFSPDGHLLQAEYAMEAVRRGAASIGITGKDCVVLAVERRAVAKLQESRTVRKLVELDEHIAMAFSGLNADARVLVDKARVECQSHRLTVDDAPTPEYIAQQVASIQQQYTQRGGVRPFGISNLIAGFTMTGEPQLWHTDPTGVYSRWAANAVGRNSKSLLEFLETRYKPELTEAETVRLAVQTLLEVVESGAKSMELAVLRFKQPIQFLEEAAITPIVAAVEAEQESEAKRKEADE